jgi:hypothetical protein
MDQMDERYWIRLLPWRRKNRPESKSAQIKFAPQLILRRKDGWKYLELLLVNGSSWTVWVEEAGIVLANLRAILQTEIAAGEARCEILQNVGPNEKLGVSLAEAVDNAAGRPQGKYSCLVTTNVRYRVFEEWCDVKLETCRVEMAGLLAVGLSRARWYDRRIKRINGLVDLTKREHKV